MKTYSIVVACLIALPIAAQQTLLVPSQYPTIQAAIYAAVAGDTVEVAAGTHFGAIDFVGKAVTVRSVAGPATTIINASGSNASAVRFASGETAMSVLEGFTIRSGAPPSACVSIWGAFFGPPGGGISIQWSSPVIRNCVVTQNFGAAAAATSVMGCSASQGGPGGIEVAGGAPLIEDCRIFGNFGGAGSSSPFQGALAAGNGGVGGLGVRLYAGGAPIVRRCRIEQNFGGTGGSAASFGAPDGAGGTGGVEFGIGSIAENCIIAGNFGGAGNGGASGSGGIGGVKGPGTLLHCTVFNNSSGPTSSGLSLPVISSVTVKNSIIIGACNSGTTGFYSCFSQAVTGVGNLVASPVLEVTASGIPGLHHTSPCIEAGDPNVSGLPSTDFLGGPRVLGAAPDMGAIEFTDVGQLGSREDFVMQASINGGAYVGLEASITTGDSIVFTLASPSLTFANRVVALLGQVFVPNQPPTSPAGFPELKVGLPGVVVLFDGFTIDPQGAVGLPTSGSLVLPYVLLAGAPGLVGRAQAIAFHPASKNGIFATSDAIDFAIF